MIPRTTQSSSDRFSDPLRRSPATAASAIAVHLELGAVKIGTTKSQSLDTSRITFPSLDTATHSIDTPPVTASDRRSAALLRPISATPKQSSCYLFLLYELADSRATFDVIRIE